MKVVLAIDSFKGSLTCTEAAAAAALGIKDIYPDATTVICPVADGGEGTVEAMVTACGGSYAEADVSDPLGRRITATYGLLPGGSAVIEMSAAAGITLISDAERDPMMTDTYGVGELILAAARRGVRDFIIGIGGSATNDGGVGMLRALGYRFLDREGRDIPRGGAGLAELVEIDTRGVDKLIPECRFFVASDVKNPLCGPNGATYVYGPQKGATEITKPLLDGYLARLAELTQGIIPTADADMPGAGAAGGLGFALVNYLGATLSSGVELIIERVGLRDKIRDADIVITGEGRMDAQSAMGKLPVGVAAVAKSLGKPVIALAGSALAGSEELHEHGIDAIFPILRSPATLKEAMDKENAKENMRAAAREVFSLIKALRG